MKFPIWFSAALISASVATATAKSQNASHGLSPAEEWVVAQVTASEIADLDAAVNADHTKKFPEEKDRKLSAHFLEELLTGGPPGVKLHRHGVRINGAIIDGPIDLRNAQIPLEVWPEHCRFNGSVTFVSASFLGSVLFENSTFDADANFNSVKVGGVASFTKAVFKWRVNFEGADVGSQFSADGENSGSDLNSESFREHDI